MKIMMAWEANTSAMHLLLSKNLLDVLLQILPYELLKKLV
jgi:hypothetical protein